MAVQEVEAPEADSWSSKNQKIIVSTPKDGYLFDLKLHAKLDGHPDEVFAILADPAADKIFRGIKQVLSRQVLEDDGKGKRKLLVGHRALTRFLWLSVTFDTQLYVWEDKVTRTIAFANARNDGFMRRFEGSWHIQPFTNAAISEAFGLQPLQGSSSSSSSSGHHWPNPLTLLHKGQGKGASSTLVTLEQALAPRATPPGPVQGLVRGLCGRVLHNMMADLRLELERRKAEEAQEGKAALLLPGPKKQDKLPVASLTHAGMDLFAEAAPLHMTIHL